MTQKIQVQKINDVYFKVTAEANIRRELSDYFSFEVPGYKFTPQYRNRVWDGKIRLYSYATGQMYVGLFLYLWDWCKKHNVEMEQIDIEKNPIYNPASFDDVEIQEILSEIKLPESIIPRDYQLKAFKYALDEKRALILSPTASGKSLISYLITRYYLLTKNKKILIIVPTTSLVEQLYKDYKEYGFDVENNVSRKYHGYDIDDDKKVVISTWQSLI
jgi:CRISPR/Cas system-associated endonuclease/helicase Cas3